MPARCRKNLSQKGVQAQHRRCMEAKDVEDELTQTKKLHKEVKEKDEEMEEKLPIKGTWKRKDKKLEQKSWNSSLKAR